MSKILDGLWIGGSQDAYDLNFMRYAKISHVINCTPNLKTEYGLSVSVYQCPLQDCDSPEEEPDARQLIIEAATLLHKLRQSQTRPQILVHCAAGISRSPAVVMAWLILFQAHTYDDAWTRVARVRDIVYPNQYYRKILKDFAAGLSRNSKL